MDRAATQTRPRFPRAFRVCCVEWMQGIQDRVFGEEDIMFIQVLKGATSDAAGLKARFFRWVEEHAAAAGGWLGTTAGVTAEGEFVAVVRFADEASARRNSDRPEQGAWWKETQPLFDGPVEFHDYTNTDLVLGGGSDGAGFVQVIQGSYTGEGNPSLPVEDEAALRAQRPDFIGGAMGWDDSGHFTQTAYFTTEAEARAGEQAMAGDPEARAQMEKWQAGVAGLRFLDLADPWLM